MSYELCHKSWFSRRLVKGKLQTAPRFCFCRAGFLRPPLPKGRGTAQAVVGFVFCHQKVTRNKRILFLFKVRTTQNCRNIYHRTAERHIGRSLRLFVSLCKQHEKTDANRFDGGQMISAPTATGRNVVQM